MMSVVNSECAVCCDLRGPGRRAFETPSLTGNGAKRKGQLMTLEVLGALRTGISCDHHLRYEKQHQSNPHDSDPEPLAAHGSPIRNECPHPAKALASDCRRA